MKLRDRVESELERWGRFASRHAWSVLAATILATAGSLTGLGAIRFDASMEAMLRQDDPVRLAYDAFRSRFNSDERILLLLGDGEVFTFLFLERLRDLHRELAEALPHLEEVKSLVNARRTHGTESELIVEDFLEDWPENQEALARLRSQALSNPVYRNVLLSEDGRYTVVALQVAPEAELESDPFEGFEDAPAATNSSAHAAVIGNAETAEIMDVLLPILERYRSPDFPIWVTGAPTMNWVMVQLVRRDMVRFTAMALTAMAMLLFMLFRRVSGVVLPMLVVALTLVATGAVMGIADLPVTAASQILPSFLIAIGIGFAVHLLAIFYRRFDAGASREEAVAFSLGHSGLAIIMTSLTTAGSLFSFRFADLAILSDFGWVAPAGVIVALIYTMVLLPALLALLPLRRKAPAAGAGFDFLDSVLIGLGELSVRRPQLVLTVWALLLVVGVLGASQLRLSHSPVDWIPESNFFRQSFDRLNREIHSSISIEVLIDSGREEGLSDAGLLRGLEGLAARALGLGEGGIRAGSAVSIADIVKETHQALNENDPAYYAIPEARPVIAQELLLFEQSGSEELAKLADPELRTARLSILVDYHDALDFQPWTRALEREAMEALGPEVDIEVTGRSMLMVRGLEGVLHGMVRSYAIALLVIVPLMIFIVGELGKGLVSMVPNVVPIVVAMGAMHSLGIPLDIFTALIGSICVGVAVDDTIHFMHCFRRYRHGTCDVHRAVNETLLSTGRALLFTSVVLSCGFLVFVPASMKNVSSFGIVAALSVATAFLADVTLTPAALALMDRRSSLRNGESPKIAVRSVEEGERSDSTLG